MIQLRILAAAAAVAASAAALLPTPAHAAEGCGAIYSAGQTGVGKCTYVASANGAIIASSVNWKVTVVHPNGTSNIFSGNTPAYHPSSGAPIKAGDSVTAEVFGPGSVIVGTATEGNNVVLPKP